MPTLTHPLDSVLLPSHSTAQRVHLIADDLTGACDAAAAFLPTDSVRVWLCPDGDDQALETVQAFNTHTRNLSPQDAARIASQCALRCPADSLVFKKVDSAGRGPIAAELLAAHNAIGTRLILLAPSFPAHGRIVSDGILHVYPASGHGTRLPLETLFSSRDRASLVVIDRPAELPVALAARKRIAICNAETDEELEALVRVAATLPARVLYAGSAGLAHALAFSRQRFTENFTAGVPVARNPLIVVGTQHPVTQLQLAHLNQQLPQANLLTVRCEAGDADQIRSHFEQTHPQALILTGGDTALLTLRALHARSIVLQGEITPGIPWGIVDDGLANGRIVITKSGGFGSAATLSHILSTLAGNE